MPSESDKWGWEHVTVFGGFDRGTGTKRWKCNHCNLRYNGSYSRVRAHLLGFTGVGVKSCPAIDRSLREAFQILEEERLAGKKKRIPGSAKPGKRIRTPRPSLTLKTIPKEDVDDMIARFVYADGLNVNVINSPYFHEMVKAIAASGPGSVQRIVDLKQALQEAVVSEEFKQLKLNMPGDNEIVESAILGDDFWCKAHLFLQLCEPFVRLLATFDIEKSVMGAVYDWQVQALEAVRSYILNPSYFGKGQNKDKTVMRGWRATLERYECDGAVRRILREQLSSYWRLDGSFGEEDAVDCRDKMEPVAWWENFGFETPHLQTLAIKVLSQVSSVSTCREIWRDNDFPCREAINRLGVERVEDLIFVRNNLRLHNQRSGHSSSSSSQRNLSLSYQSGLKSWDGVHVDETMAIVSVHDKL